MPKSENVQPTVKNLLDEVTQKRISIVPRVSRHASDGEYITLAEQLQGEFYNRQALNHLHALI